MKYLYFFIYCSIVSSTVYSQKVIESSSKEKPSWFDQKPESDKFIYYVGYGENESQLEARKFAAADVLQQLSEESRFTIQMESETNFTKRIVEEKDSENINQTIEIKGVMKNSSENVVIQGLARVEDFWQMRQIGGKSRYEYWVLMRRPKSGYENFKITENQSYGAAPVWRSAIFPGWGQMYKKEKRKGISFLITEAFILSGAIFTNSLYTVNYNKANDATNISTRKNFMDNADKCATSRDVALTIAGAIYILNIIDVSTSRGAKIYAEKRQLNIYPLVCSKSIGVGCMWNF